jgi:putative hemolysin
MKQKGIAPILIVVAALAVFLAAGGVYWYVATMPKEEQKQEEQGPVVSGENIGQVANPASVYCEKQGGKLEIRTGADGGQTGFCVLSGGSECEEWKYFRGECGKINIDTSDWQTYRNEECGFEIKHPASWEERVLLHGSEGILLTATQKSYYVAVICHHNISEIDAQIAAPTQQERKTMKTLEDYMKKSVYHNIKESNFAGEKSFFADYPKPAADYIELEPTIFLDHGGHIYKITYDILGEPYGLDTETKTVLGTFKFIN